MPAAFLTLLGPLIPWILGLGAVVVGYFGIRQRGIMVERQRQEAAQQKAQAQAQVKVQQAQSKDAAIDQKVEAQVAQIKKENPVPVDAPPADGDVFKF